MDFLIHHMLRSSAERSPDKEAMVCGDTRLCYRKAWEHVCGLAAGLRKLGMERGDRVGVYMEPSVTQALSIFGIARAGGVFVPINEVLFPEQVAHIANDCRMRGLITSQARVGRLQEALGVTNTVDFVVVVTTEDPLPAFKVETRRFEDIAGETPPSAWREESIEKDLAALIYTQ